MNTSEPLISGLAGVQQNTVVVSVTHGTVLQADFAVCAFGVNDVLAVFIAIEEDVLNFQRRAAGNINHNVVMVGLYTAGVAHPQAGVLGVGVALRNGFTAHADGVGVLGTPGADQTQIFADGQHLVQWDGDLAGKIDRSAFAAEATADFSSVQLVTASWAEVPDAS